MKKSEKLQTQAVNELLKSFATFAASVAVGVWSVSAFYCNTAGGLLVAVIALAGLAASFSMAGKGVHLLRLSDREDRYEMERAVRPRL